MELEGNLKLDQKIEYIYLILTALGPRAGLCSFI